MTMNEVHTNEAAPSCDNTGGINCYTFPDFYLPPNPKKPYIIESENPLTMNLESYIKYLTPTHISGVKPMW